MTRSFGGIGKFIHVILCILDQPVRNTNRTLNELGE
jgi:hypothetical protein